MPFIYWSYYLQFDEQWIKIFQFLWQTYQIDNNLLFVCKQNHKYIISFCFYGQIFPLRSLIDLMWIFISNYNLEMK